MDSINRRHLIQRGLAASIGGLSLAQAHAAGDAIASESTERFRNVFGMSSEFASWTIRRAGVFHLLNCER